MNYDWSNLAFSDKKPLKDLQAIFIAAPREMSGNRIKELIKAYLPQGNVVFGLAKEAYVDGFDSQPQFRTLTAATLDPIVKRVNAAGSVHQVAILHYFQRELPFVIGKLRFRKAVFINGSWSRVFHGSPAFYELATRNIPYELVSPFTSPAEGKAYESLVEPQLETANPLPSGDFSASQMLKIAQDAAHFSFDYCFQTGVAIGKKKFPGSYSFSLRAFNKIVPTQTYALHYGSSRERHFSPPNDLNFYDTVHAEVEAVLIAQARQLDLSGQTMFINLLPCPACGRMIADTPLREVVYMIDHSDGYTLQLLELAGKKVRRVLPTPEAVSL